MLDELHAPHVATFLLPLLDALHRAKRDAAGFIGRRTSRHFEFNPLLDMKLEFVVQLPFEASTVEECSQTKREPMEPSPFGHGLRSR